LSQFSRRARWLNALFPASVLPQTGDPGSVSDDVSLVQQYDGGGWAIPRLEDWFISGLTLPAAASGDTNLLTVPNDSVFRVFAISCFTVTLAVATVNVVISQLPLVGGVVVTPNISTLALALGQVNLDLNAMVVPPGASIRGAHFNGNGTTVLSWAMYGCLAPAGTAFSL